MIKVIILDFFGVFCPEMARGWISKNTTLTEEITNKLNNASELLDTGHMSMSDFFTEISRFTSVPENEVEAGIRAQERIDQGVVDIAHKLSTTHRLGLASNANTQWLMSILERHKLEDIFEHIIISAEIGIAKPDERFFTHTASRFETAPHEILFIDDKQSNVDAAVRVGMQAILFTNSADLSSSLIKLSIMPDTA